MTYGFDFFHFLCNVPFKFDIGSNLLYVFLMSGSKLLFLALFVSQSAFATAPDEGLDAKVGVSGQSYPSGGILTGVVGYGRTLWHDPSHQNESDFWQYGYVRSSLEWKTAAVVNRITADFEFFPISIFGVSGGAGSDYRNYDQFNGVDCTTLICDRRLDFKFLQAQLTAGISKFIGVAIARYDWQQAPASDKPFYDYMSYLIGHPGHDDLRSLTLIALYRHDEKWSYGTIAFFQQMILSEGNYSSAFGVANFKDGPWQATLGLGAFQSDHQRQNPAALFQIQYVGRKSIGL
jgi:hypothetical protein